MRWVSSGFLALLIASRVLAAGAAADAAAGAVSAGEPAFETIGMRYGLSSGSATAVMVDRHGFVWFAGDNGVHRYDGQQVHSIDRDPERSDTLVSRTNNAIAQAGDAIWIQSFNGVLQRLDPETGAITPYVLTRGPERQTPGRGARMVADRNERLWIGTDIGLFRFDAATRTQVAIDLVGGPTVRITALALSPDGRRVLVGCVDGRVVAVDVEEPARQEPLFTLATLDQAPVPLAIAAWQQQLWLGTTQGLFRYDQAARTLDRANVPLELARERVQALVVGRDGALWFGSAQRAGLYYFDPATGRSAIYRHHPDDPNSLPADRIVALALDPHENLWLGLERDGASRLRIAQQGAVVYRAEDGRSNSFCAVRDMPDSRLLVSLCGGSVEILDPRSGQLSDRAGAIDQALAFPAPTLTSHAIVADGSGGYWLPTGGLGLLHWQPQLGRASHVPLQTAAGEPLPDSYMNDARLDRNGRLWVACSLGLASIGAGEGALRLLDRSDSPGMLLTGGVLAVAAAADGRLVLGTTQGLVLYDPVNGHAARYAHAAADPQSLSDDLVLSTHVDADGALWVGTQAGLNRALPAPNGALRFRRYGRADGLPDQTIASIVADTGGTLWIGTNHGIASFDAPRDRFRTYAPGDGVPDGAVNWRSALAAADGSVYFGTAAGLLRIFPERLHNAPAQPLMLSSYELGGVSRINLRGPAVAPLSTGYTQARVRFNVAAFGDQRPLSYRLTGLQAQWLSMPASLSVGYDPLPPGDYRFEVRQMGPSGTWSAPGLSVPLSVMPPPWRSRGAYVLYAAIALGVVVLLAGAYRNKRARELRHVRELRHLATYDTLTELPNRTRFGEELAEAMAQEGPARLALFFIDLDRFKNINDSLGHHFGDRVLMAAAMRLREALPAAARLARLGGDEFTAILPNPHHEREAALVAQALLDAFATPLRVEGSDVVVTLSIGISVSPEHASDPATLVQYADSAMYYAKAGGRNAYRFFQPEMTAQVSRRLALETSLRHALELGELYPVYQPLLELATERVRGVEVLLRWDSAEHGMVAPLEFIPILEDTGMIEAVGLWLIEQVCAQVRAWRQAQRPQLCVAVNVSVHQLIRGELCERLAQLLSSMALPRHTLELEVTESALMENAQRMGAALGELRSLGLGLAIDDFGTGYSSFASLSHLPVNKLKIDKAFIDDVGKAESADTLCAAIIAMAHNLKLTVVAEGVETELQHRTLKAMGCDEAQGYWYCKPLRLEEFEQFLRARAERPSVA